MLELKLDGSKEVESGKTYSARKGVADGLEGAHKKTSVPKGHERAYEDGFESGKKWGECISGDVAKGVIDLIRLDAGKVVPSDCIPVPDIRVNDADASAEQRLGHALGRCLVTLIKLAEKK